MDAFTPHPPEWIDSAKHAYEFCCPCCQATPMQAKQVWINRYSPVTTSDYRRKWQEFYACTCGQVWWAWSTDRPPSEIIKGEDTQEF